MPTTRASAIRPLNRAIALVDGLLSAECANDLEDGLGSAKWPEFERPVVAQLMAAYFNVTSELRVDEVPNRAQVAIDRAVAEDLRSDRYLVTFVGMSLDRGDGFVAQ